MQFLRSLLKRDDSNLSSLVKFSLYGLKASLKLALQKYTSDTGYDDCKNFLLELDELLEISDAKSLAPNTQPPIEVEQELQETKLNQVCKLLEEDRDLLFYLGYTESSQMQWRNSTDVGVWHEIQCLLLRLPDTLAKSWQGRILNLAQEFGALTDKEKVEELPFYQDELVYPGLTGAVNVRGLHLSVEIPIDTRLNLARPEGNLKLLAQMISFYTKIIRIDLSLHHALKSSYSVVPLTSEQEISKYLNSLIDRFKYLQSVENNQDRVDILKAWLDMDEVIHSLVHQPPADRYSWWGQAQRRVRDILKEVAERTRKAGHDVKLRDSLWGNYADIYKYTKDDLALDSGGYPGDVLACLRVYAEINGQKILGRVLYRPK